jgi:hypothetical protein
VQRVWLLSAPFFLIKTGLKSAPDDHMLRGCGALLLSKIRCFETGSIYRAKRAPAIDATRA